MTEQEIIKRAQQGGAEIRYEFRRDFLKTHHAYNSITKLKEMLKRGFDVDHLKTHYGTMFPRYPFELILKPAFGLE